MTWIPYHKRPKPRVGTRTRTHRGEPGVIVRRRNTGMGFRQYTIRLDNGRTVYLCWGAVQGFELEKVAKGPGLVSDEEARTG